MTSCNRDKKCVGHIAQNYWFHPPDNLDSEHGFEKPYISGYWPTKWESQPDCREESPTSCADMLPSTDLANTTDVESSQHPLSERKISGSDENGSASSHEKKRQKTNI